MHDDKIERSVCDRLPWRGSCFLLFCFFFCLFFPLRSSGTQPAGLLKTLWPDDVPHKCLFSNGAGAIFKSPHLTDTYSTTDLTGVNSWGKKCMLFFFYCIF